MSPVTQHFLLGMEIRFCRGFRWIILFNLRHFFTSNYIANNPFFIVCQRSFFLKKKTTPFLLRFCRNSQIEMWSIQFIQLKYEAPTYRRYSGFQILHNGYKKYVEYLCHVACQATWIHFNRCIDLVIINDRITGGTFSVFFAQLNLGYGNISINVTYL